VLCQVDGTALSGNDWRWIGYAGDGHRDGNGDGNPGRRARSRLNGPVRLTSATAIPTGAALHLESKCMSSQGGQRAWDSRAGDSVDLHDACVRGPELGVLTSKVHRIADTSSNLPGFCGC
jgi:hypothetical protein